MYDILFKIDRELPYYNTFVNVKFCFIRKRNHVIYEINLLQENNNYISSKFKYRNLCYKRHHLPQPWSTLLLNFDQPFIKKIYIRKKKIGSFKKLIFVAILIGLNASCRCSLLIEFEFYLLTSHFVIDII